MISSKEMSRIIHVKMATLDIKRDSDLCRAIGIRQDSFCHYMSGRQTPPLPVLSRICSYLGMTQEERGAFLM